MNERDFNDKLKSIGGHDLRLIFDPRKKLWGVYQVRKSVLLLKENPDRPWILFDITDDKGEFRLPDMRDIARAAMSVSSAHQMWRKGGDWYDSKIREQEDKREEKRLADQKDLLHQAAKDIKFHMNVVNHGRLKK